MIKIKVTTPMYGLGLYTQGTGIDYLAYFLHFLHGHTCDPCMYNTPNDIQLSLLFAPAAIFF